MKTYKYSREEIAKMYFISIGRVDNLQNDLLATTTKSSKEKSKCCNANVRPHSGDEGTNYYECEKCGEPCDIKSSKEKGTGCSENTLLEAKMNTKFSKSSKEKEIPSEIREILMYISTKQFDRLNQSEWINISNKYLNKGEISRQIYSPTETNQVITPTPSTNIKEIELLKVDELSYCSYKQWTKIMNKINEITNSLNTIIKK